jgi:hypothetical protein
VPTTRTPGRLVAAGVGHGEEVLGQRGPDGVLGLRLELVQHARDPLLAAPHRLPFGQSLGGLQLRRHGVAAGGALRADAVVRIATAGLERGHLGLGLGDVLLLAHPDRALAPAVEELLDDRLLRGEQLLTRAEHDQVPAEQQAEVVGHGPRGPDVVRDDEEGGVGLRVQVDDELVLVGHADRVETGVRLVEQDDLGVEHEGSGEAGALAHTAGDLAGQLSFRALETDHLHLLEDDVLDLGLALLGVLAQGEGDVVEEVHRAEQGAVLEQDAEQLPDLVELVLAAPDDVGVLDDDRPPLGLEQPDQRLEEHRLARAGGAEHHRDLTAREREGDVAPDVLAAEGLRQPFDLYRHAHVHLPELRRPCRPARRHHRRAPAVCDFGGRFASAGQTHLYWSVTTAHRKGYACHSLVVAPVSPGRSQERHRAAPPKECGPGDARERPRRGCPARAERGLGRRRGPPT